MAAYVQFEVIGKLWLATNSLPQINNTDHRIWRRIKAIPFNLTFAAEEQDKSLSDKLIEEPHQPHLNTQSEKLSR